jgi:hypothetical protein
VKVARTTFIIAVLLIPLLAIGCYTVAGAEGALGAVFGGGLALLSILSFGLLAKIIGYGGSPPRQMTALTTMVWLMKLPILWFVVAHVSAKGPTAVACFLAGLGLVYSVLVLTAVLESRSSSRGRF